MSIRNLISKDQWKILHEVPPEKLVDHGYLVECETCHEIFLETTLDKIVEEIKQGVWDHPQLWYVEAGKHWIQTGLLHCISIFQIYPSGTKAKRFDMTADWNRQLEDPSSPNYQATSEQMMNELEHLEDQLKGEAA